MNPDPLFTAQAIAFIAMAISLANGVVSLRRRPPIEAEFSTKAEVAHVKGELAGQLTDLRTELTAQIVRIHERIDEASATLNSQDERRTDHLRNDIRNLAVSLARIEGSKINEKN